MKSPWLLAAALITASIAGAQGAKGLPEGVAAELKAAGQLPAGQYTRVRAWKAGDGNHTRTGRQVDDAEARGGRALEVTPALDGEGAAVYGPYVELDPGDYMAFFRVKLLDALEGDIPAQIDACVGFGQDLLAARDVGLDDLAVGRYVQVPLGFHYAGGKLECRLNFLRVAGLHLDEIALFRVEGANLAGLGRVAPAVPSGQPRDLPYYSEPRPFPDLFPRSAPPARTLVVCDLSQARADLRLLLYSLQGLVNRSQPRLYCISVTGDSFWLQNLQERGLIQGTEVVAEPLALLSRFRDCFKGAIVTDPFLPASKNVATMLAAVREGLVTSPRLAAQLGLPVLEDLRGRWTTSVDAYRWAFDTLWPQLNHHVLACSYPDHLALRDYLVEHKVFIFWLSGPIDGARPYSNPDAEVRLLEELLPKMPVNTPIMSYCAAGKDVGIGEGPGVSLFAQFGHYLVGSIDASNLSVHSGVQVADLRQPAAPAAPPLDESRVYVSWLMSDGDNLPVLTLSNFPQLWADKRRGRLPIGWTLSPAATMLIPDVVDYFYRTETPNDCFMGAVSGVGYTYPDEYGQRFRAPDRQKVLDEFISLSAQYLKRADQNQLWVCGATKPDVLSRFVAGIPFLDALFPDYGRRVVDADEATYASVRNVPVFHAVTGWREDATREERLAQLVRDIRTITPVQKPAFLQAFALNWFTDLELLEDAQRQLGPDYVFVRPDHLAQLWRADMRRRQVHIRLPATAACVDGLPLALTGSVRNMTDQAFEISLALGPGVEGGTVTPARTRLEAAEQAAVTISGPAAGETLTLAVAGPFGTRERAVRLRHVARGEVLDPLPPAASLAPVTCLNAEALAHRTGAAEADPEAGTGRAWVAQRNTTRPDTIVFGPYTTLEPGRYLVMFRVKRLDEGTGVLALLDTCSPPALVVAKREVRCEELPLGQYRYVPVVFEHGGGGYETRVTWSGAATLAVDVIPVWRLPPR